MRLIGIEPTHAAPEATALSTELQTHLLYITTFFQKNQVVISFFYRTAAVQNGSLIIADNRNPFINQIIKSRRLSRREIDTAMAS